MTLQIGIFILLFSGHLKIFAVMFKKGCIHTRFGVAIIAGALYL